MFARILKHNPYHGPDGKFTDSDAATFVSTAGVFAARRASGGSKGGGGGGGGVDSRDYQPLGALQAFATAKHSRLAELEGVDDAALDSLRDYTGGGFGRFNGYLRGQRDDDFSKQIADIDRALDAVGAVGQDLVVYRGVKGNTGQKIKDALDKGTLVGSTLTDKGYTSTSVHDKVAQTWGGVLVNLKVPKESKGAYVGESTPYENLSKYSNFPSERELILERGGTMRFTGGRKDGTKYIVDAIWEPPKRGKS